MNEQAIQDAYNLFVQTGYKGDINAFSNLIKTNPNALNDSYNLFVDNGYNKSYDDFKTLVGVNQAQGADLLKKKGQGPMAQMVPKNTTESFVEESLSASQPKAQVAPKQKAGILAQPFIKPTTESFLETVSAEPSTQPSGVKEVPPVKEKNYFTGDFGTALAVADVVTPFKLGEFIDDIGRSIASGYRSGALVTPANEVMLQGKKASPEQIQKYLQAAKEMEGLGPSDEMQNFSKIYDESGKGVFGFLKGLAYNPTVLPEIIINSTAMLANPTAIGSAAATLAAGGATGIAGGLPGIAAGVARAVPYAMGAASTTLETGLTFSELLKEELDKKGLEFNEKNVKDLLQDDKIVSSLRGRSVARGATIGIVDALTNRLAGSVGKNVVAAGTAASRIKSGIASAGIEAVGGSAGEAAGRLVAGQPMDVAEIGLEGITSVPSAIPAVAAEVLNKPIYKINGQRVTEADVKDIVDNTPVAELGNIDFDFKNDRSGWSQVVQQKVVTHSTKEQVREANPDLNETSLDAITKLELDLQKLQGNTTQSGKDKAAALRQQIKDIQENQLQEEAAQQNVLGNAYRSQRISDAEKALAQPENKKGTVIIDDKEVKRVELEKELETLKAEQNAIQEQSTNAEMLRSEQPELGLREVGEGDTGPTEPTTASTEVITDEKSQEIGTQVGDLVETLNLFNQGTQQGGTPNEKSVRTRRANKAYKKLGEFFGFPYGSLETEEQSAKQNALRALGEMLNQESTKGYTAEGGQNYQFADVNQLMTAYKEDKANGVASPVVQSIDTLLGITPAAAPEVVTETVTEQVPAVSSKTQEVSAQEITQQINALEKEKVSLTSKALKQMPNSPIQLETRARIDEIDNQISNLKAKQNEQVQPQRTGDRTGRTDSRKITPLEGSPSVKGINGPDPQLVAVAEKYAADNGIDLKRQSEYVKVDEERAKRIADAYEQMADDPQNPKVKEAYQELIKQTMAQYQALVDAGYKFWFMDLNIPSNLEYAESPYNALRDMRENQEMGVFPTTDGYGEGALTELDVESNPLLADTGLQWPVGGLDGPMKPVLANDLFRAVHDAFGHGLEGAGFRARGEENAWQAHARLFTGPAIGALTSETRGQNSWLNFGPEGEKNRTAKVEDTVFAEQKIGLMPEWTWTEGRAGDMEVEAVEEQAPVTEQAPVEEAVVEEEQFIPLNPKEVTFDTKFSKDEASDYQEDEREGENGRYYPYFSEIETPVFDVDGEQIGYLVKMVDDDKNLTFEARDEDGNPLSKNEEGFDTLGEARQALVDNYNKIKKKEFDKEAKAKAKERAKQAEKAAAKVAKAAAKEGTSKVEETAEDLLDVDVSQKDGLDKVYGFLDSLDNNIKKQLSKGLNDATFAIPLGVVQQIVKGLKVLVKGGMTLRDAIRSMSKETDVAQETIRDIITITPIQEEFNALMAKVDTLIARQKSKNVAEAKIISNVDTFIRNSDVYKAADDAQKKILEREGRVKMNARERRAPSIGRVLGALQDFTNITREEKIQIIKQIRTLSQNAAKSLSKEINELASSGSITPKQVAAIINRFGKVNLLNEISVANFVDYMAKVFNDAEYADKISVAKKQLAIAKKNIETKIGKADGLMIPLRQMLAINPNLIPDSVFNEYLSLVDMFGQRRTVLSLAEKSEITKQVNNILEAVNKEQFEADNLAFVMRESKNVVYNENGTIDFAETLKKMVKEGEITQEDADLMRKYKSEILPQVEPEPKSDKEIEAEKQDLLNALSKTEVQTLGLPSRDERNLANSLAKLIRTDAVKSLTNADLKNLLRVIDNINNNFLPNYASLMVGKLNGINKGKVLDNSITKAIPLAISKFASRVKSVFTGENNPAFEMIKRGPQMSIDEMLGDFKSNNVFKSLFESVSEAASTYKTEIKKIQNILEEAENKIAKSFKRNQEEITMSKYKIMTYLIQLEYDSNPNNEQVNPASSYIKETIKLIQSETSQYNKEDMKKFESILKEYNDGKGGIDNKKLYDSFNPAEKSAIKDIRGINESLAEKAAFTASVIRGDKFNPLTNYVHLNVLSDTGLDESFTPEYMTRFDNSMRPSTKAKSLIERTKGAKALNFDAFASAQRGANFVLMDYNLTPAIREAHITLNQTLANLQQQANEKAREKAKKDGVTDENELNQIEGVIPQKERRIYNALKSAFELATADLLQTSSLDNSVVDDAVDYITKQGYRTTLAGTGRFAAELLSNLSAVAILDPVAYYNGVADFGKFSMNQDAATFMMNVKSKSTSRLYGSNPLSGRIVDTNILNQASGMKGAKSIGAIENRIMQSWNYTGKKVVNGIELTADALVATPDKVVSIPFWFGSFAKKFKQITGEDIDRQKVVEDDEAYMNKYEDAIREAKNFADNRATTIASTDNPYMNILKGKSKKEQTALTKAFNVFNNFLTNFNIVDFYNLRRGVYSLMGKGMLTQTEGARLMGAIATRSIIYLTLGKLFGDGILGMISGDDEEEKEDNTWYQMIGQAIASTATSAFIGRDFGNAVRLFLNSAIEYGNEKYLDFLRTGPYDRFKDSIQFSAIPEKKGNLPLGLVDFALPLSGPLQPALKTTDFVIKTWTADEKKEAAAKERQEKNKYIRTPIEIAGNLGAILMYKDVRKLVMKDINKTLIQEQKAAADKKANKLRLLQGFETEGDMKRYEPELWDRTFGPSSEGYDARQEEKRLKREQKKLEQAIEDEERGYVPPAPKSRSKSSGFGPQKGSSSSGFGPQNKKGKSGFGPQ